MQPLNRRHFLCASAGLVARAAGAQAFWPFSDGGIPRASGRADIRGTVFKGDAPDALWTWSREAFLYRKLDDGRVMCEICPNQCLLAPGDRSVCRSKINWQGKLYTLAYGNPCTTNIDPIEKKPLYHFLPRSRAFSLAATGCNLRCLNCQNWEISQARPEDVRRFELFPEEAVRQAAAASAESIAYTYSEAITFFEYMIAIARPARKAGIHNLLISNGYINRPPLLELCRVLDGANINLKSFRDETYRRLNGGRLQPVLNTLTTLHAQGVHLEITTLVVPGYVDDPGMIREMCAWILAEIGPDHPLHFLRFFPRYKLDRLPPTPVSTLTRLREIAMDEGLHYVYVGNVPGHEGNHTYCHRCGRRIIERQGYYIPDLHLDAGRCAFCSTPIPGVWQPRKAARAAND